MASGRADDPLSGLLSLPGVQDSVTAARSAIDEMLWDRRVARQAAALAAESALRGAWANARLEGAEVGLAQLRSGAALDDSPLGRLLSGAVAMHGELDALVPVIGSAPAQALARLHAIVSRGWVPEEELGRPRIGLPDDPLRAGPAPEPDQVGQRLLALGDVLVRSTAPGVLVAVVAHAEVASLRPFSWGSGLVARAMLRLVLASRGVDPQLLGSPELGLLSIARPAYVRGLRGYGTAEPAAVADFVGLVARAVALGAQQPAKWLTELEDTGTAG